MLGKYNYNNYNIDNNTQYYQSPPNPNASDLSKYNFTNTKPVPLKPFNSNKQQYYTKKPQTSHLINRPIDKKELNEAKLAMQSLNARIKRTKTDNTSANNNIIRTNTAQDKKRVIPQTQIQQQQAPFKKQPISFQPAKPKPQVANNNTINRGPVIYKEDSKSQQPINYNPSNNINSNNNVYSKNASEQYQYDNVNNNKYGYNDDNENDARKLDIGYDNQSSNKEYMNAEQGEPTYPCPDCGRKFIEAVYHKHIKICKNVFQKKRKAFDMKQARILDEEHANIIKQAELQDKKQSKTKQQQITSKPIKAIPKWKRQSEEFRRIISGGTSNPASFGQQQQQIPSYNEDYTLCQFCNRRYNEQAYNKHLAGCERRFKEAQIKNKNKSTSSTNVNATNVKGGYYYGNSSGSKNSIKRK